MADGSLTSLPLKLLKKLGARRSSRSRHHLSGVRHQPDGAGYPRHYLSSLIAAAIRATRRQVKTERKRQDKSARCAEKGRHQAATRPLLSLVRLTRVIQSSADSAHAENSLASGQIQAI